MKRLMSAAQVVLFFASAMQSIQGANPADKYVFRYQKIPDHGYTYTVSGKKDPDFVLAYAHDLTTLHRQYALSYDQLRTLASDQEMRIKQSYQAYSACYKDCLGYTQLQEFLLAQDLYLKSIQS